MRPKGKLFALFAVFAAIGLVTASGAFTTVQAERTVTVDTAGDANALLAMEGNSTSNNGDYVNNNNGEVVIDFSQSNIDGVSSENPEGVNINATTNVSHMLNITNQGSQTVDVYIDASDVNDQSNNLTVEFYQGDSPGTSLDNSNQVSLDSGDTQSVGISIKTTGNVSVSGNVTVYADAQ
jgi:hypothetical protein